MHPESRSPLADAAISALAAAQHGVLARRQLLAEGVTADAIKGRVRAGRLVRMYRGVYAAGHSELTLDGQWMAAVLACGPGAALSHRAAAALWCLRPAWRHWLEVSAPGHVRVPGVITHRVRTMEATTHQGIPVTTVARTLTDLADVTSPRILRQVLDQAEILRLHAPIKVMAGRKGAGNLKRALTKIDPLPHMPRSELERRFLDLCAERPAAGLAVEGHETDFAWPEHRLIVELDGWETHRTHAAFQSDRRRDVSLRLAGWTVLRFTYNDVFHDPSYVTATLSRSCGRSTSITWAGSG
jgi:very-short-patch-repair endonuclease